MSLSGGRELRVLTDRAEGDPPERDRGYLLEDCWGVGRDVDAEALGEPRDPGELVRRRWDDGAAEALHASFEIHVRAVAFEVARPRQDEVGPAAGERVEHRDHEHALGLLGQCAYVPIRRPLVAR